MNKMDIPEFNDTIIYYYFNEKVTVLRIFAEMHMAKIHFVESAKERIVDISGISKEPVHDISVSISLLGGEKG